MTSCLGLLPETERRRLAQIEAQRRGLMINPGKRFERFRFDPTAYIEEKLDWEPWAGEGGHPGQVEVIDAYTLALRQLHEKDDWEQGLRSAEQLEYWTPGQSIQNRLRIEAGHTVGKTKLCSGLVNHFFDCFPPAIIYTFAPTWDQIHDLLWKEIKVDRTDKGLPGRILDLRLDVSPNHFATGKATNDAGGRGSHRIHGQHNRYLMFVLDEAEGIPGFVWRAVDSMASGGIVIVVMVANPETRSSTFHKQKNLSTVRSFRISCIHHPNVVQGREVVPGAVRREYVAEMIEKHCEVITSHDEDRHTFELAFAVQIGETVHPAGTVFLPNAEFMFRVLGIAPKNIADKTLVPVGRFEAACQREAPWEDEQDAWLGVDVARFGKDFGTLYRRHLGTVKRVAQFWHQDTGEYYDVVREEAKSLHAQGVRRLRIRVDAGGGYGGGLVDQLIRDEELRRLFAQFDVLEVHFNGTPSDEEAFADLITEMHSHAAETLKGIRIESPPETLEGDLCEREFKWVNLQGRSVKKLESKDDFRKPNRAGRSPDDGDGFVLCVAPDFLFGGGSFRSISREEAEASRSSNRGASKYRDGW